MIFRRVGFLFLVSIFINSEIALLQKQQCKVCSIRNFKLETQKCECSEDFFCNKNQCQKCDECYDYWKNIILKRQGEIENIVEKIITKYIGDLQKELKTLRELVNKSENEFKQLNLTTNQTKPKIIKVYSTFKKLEQDLKRVEEQLQKLKNQQSIQDLVNYLKELKQNVRKIVDKLLKFEEINLDETEKFKGMSSQIDEMLNNFPIIKKNSYNLALSLASDIDLLESIISGFSGNFTTSNQFPYSLNSSTQWIEQDLLWFFDLLNNYQNVTIDTDRLFKNASKVRSSAEQTDETLKSLLEKEKKFEKLLNDLKYEMKQYQDINDLNKRLQTLTTNIKEYKQLIKILRRKENLLQELTSLQEERDQFNKIENKVSQKKAQFNELLKEMENLLKKLHKYKKYVEPKSTFLARTEKMIQEMIEEVMKIDQEILKKCSST